MVFIIVPKNLKEMKLSNVDISNGSYTVFMTYSGGLVAGCGVAFAVKHIVLTL